MAPRPASWSQGRQYGVVIDAGSSGSRIQVYSWVTPEVAKQQRKAQGKSTDVLSRVEKGVEEGEGWHLKVEPGISTFGDNPQGVAEYLRPLIEHAASVIPADQLSQTPIYLLATAGMRLLPSQQQSDVLSAACSYLRTYPFQLPDCDDQVRIISGEEEGLYGWIAVNYLMDGFDKHEHTGAGEKFKHSSTYGFLDMGGASTQIAFEPSDTEQVKHADNLLEVKLRLLSGKDVRHPVFVTTWLGFGTNQARNRYVDQEVKKHLRESDAAHVPGDGERLGSEHPVVLVDDPCLPAHLMLSEARHAGYTLRGTGDFAQCLRRQQPLLNKEVACLDEPCLFNGVHVPPIDFSVNHFIGISEYWYSTQDVWGAALGGVYDYVAFEKHAMEFCGQDWETIMRDFKDGHGAWTPSVELSRLETQCFKAAWIINILHEGIGIPRIIDRGGRGDGRNQTEKGINKAVDKNLLDQPPSFQSMNEVGDVAISWTLGKMVLEVSKGTAELPPGGPSGAASSGSWSYGESLRYGSWTGHIPSWKGDMRTTIAAVTQSDALPFVGLVGLVVLLYAFVVSPSSARRRKAFCGPLFGSPRRREAFLPLSQDDPLGLGGSSGDSSGSRTPPRGGRRKSSTPAALTLVGRAFAPLRLTALRLSSALRSWSRGRGGAALSRTSSAGNILPLARPASASSEMDQFRPRTIRTSKSSPFLRSATVVPSSSSTSSTTYWNDAPDFSHPTSSTSAGPERSNTTPHAAVAALSSLPRSSSGPALALGLTSLPRSSSPPPMAIIPPSPLSRPTTPSSISRRLPGELSKLTTRSRDSSADEPRPYSYSTSSGVLSPAPHSASASTGPSLAAWDDYTRDETASPTPGVGAVSAAGAKLRASRSANSSLVNLASAGGGGYFSSAGGGEGSARRTPGALGLQPLAMASVSSTSLGGGSSGGVSPGPGGYGGGES
ncbi:hypothetical protein JCM10207_008047 [Rhodosporidiobolus poonsookiae]